MSRDLRLTGGEHVVVHNSDGGTFTGVVAEFTNDGNVAIIRPDDEAVRRWYPRGYNCGCAHWGTVIRPIRPPEPPPSDEDREAQAAYDDFWKL